MAGRARGSGGVGCVEGVAQLVERKPSKLDVAGSSPVSRFRGERGTGNGNFERRWARIPTLLRAVSIGSQFPDPGSRFARVAQLVEHTLGKGEVTGSIPVASSEGSRSDR